MILDIMAFLFGMIGICILVIAVLVLAGVATLILMWLNELYDDWRVAK